MTKMKSKKMTKSTFAIIIMAIAMVAMLAFGGTYAYFTAHAKEATSGELTTGKISISANAVTKVEKSGLYVPGDKVVSAMSFTNDSDVAAHLVIKVSATVNGTAASQDVLDVNIDTSKWTAQTGKDNVTYYVASNVAAGEVPSILTSEGIVFMADTNYEDGAFDNVGTDYMSAKIEVTIESWAIQAENVTDPLVELGLKAAA